MSLIPSESLSFPDEFSRSISRARVLHETKRFVEANQSKKARTAKKRAKSPAAEEVESVPVSPGQPLAEALQNLALKQKSESPPQSKTSRPIEASPQPKRQPSIPAPIQPAAPPPSANPEPVAAAPTAPAARTPIPRKPPLRRFASQPVPTKSEVRPAGPKRFGPVRVLKPAPISTDPTAKSSPIEPVSEPDSVPMQAVVPPADLSLQPEFALPFPDVVRSRRRRRWLRFLITETLALVVLVPCVLLVISHRVQQPAALTVVNIATIAAAVLAAILPILFFAIPSKLPRA